MTEAPRQVAGVLGGASALHNVPPGEPWSRDAVASLRQRVDGAGLQRLRIGSMQVLKGIRQVTDVLESISGRHAASLGVGAA